MSLSKRVESFWVGIYFTQGSKLLFNSLLFDVSFDKQFNTGSFFIELAEFIDVSRRRRNCRLLYAVDLAIQALLSAEQSLSGSRYL